MYYSIQLKTIPGSIYSDQYILPSFSYPNQKTGNPVISGRRFVRHYDKSFFWMNDRERRALLNDLYSDDGIIRLIIEGGFKTMPVINMISVHIGADPEKLKREGYY